MPFDDLGLKETIENMIALMNQDKQFKVVTDIDDIEISISDYEKDLLLISIYRIIQECVQNSIKHSKGNEIRVKIKNSENDYKILFQDNGIGFDEQEALKKDKHFGLSVIKERVSLLGGSMDTHHGTIIKIEIPKLL